MSRTTQSKRLYQRGAYWRDWDRKKDGSLRSPHLAVFSYDPKRGRNRSTSTRTVDFTDAREALDAIYCRAENRNDICQSCGQQTKGTQNVLVLRAITDYLATKRKSASLSAICPRLAHVVNYIATLPSPNITCSEIGEEWISALREWLELEPMVSSAGNTIDRPRALSTIKTV